jgi:hypothetical protein
MTNKTLFDAVEAELENARTAISNVGAYMNMLKNAVDEMEKSAGMEAPLSLKSKNNSTVYGLPLKNIKGELKAELKLL